MEQEK
jgi:hypothetical protein